MEQKETTPADFLELARGFARTPHLQNFLEVLPMSALVMSQQGDLVFLNQHMFQFIHHKPDSSILGSSYQDLLTAVLNIQHAAPCHTPHACPFCQIKLGIEECKQGMVNTKFAHIETEEGTAQLALKMRLAPLKIADAPYILLLIEDVSQEAQFKLLEQTFLHDLQNTVGSLQGISSWLLSADASEIPEIANLIKHISLEITEEIQSQSELLKAEQHQHPLSTSKINSIDFLNSLKETYSTHPVTKGKRILIAEDCDSFEFLTDQPLLRRLINNLLKNALEIEPEGATIQLRTKVSSNKQKALFCVHNETPVKADIAEKLFKEQISTKGRSHGVGLISIKMLSERYLHGKVTFSSTPEHGTTFTVSLPFQHTH